MKKVLYLNHVSELGGGEYCLLNLMLNLDKKKFKPVLLLQEPGPLSEAAQKNNIETCFIKMAGWRKLMHMPFNYIKTLGKIKKLVKEKKIDLIHSNTFRINPYAVLSAQSNNIPCISHIRWFTKKDHIKKFMVDKATVVITMSDYMASFFKGSKAKVKTIYDGIDVLKFQANDQIRNNVRKEFGIKEGEKLVGMVAQLTPRKGHKDFIQASLSVSKEHPNAKFIIAGGAILDKQLGIKDLKNFAKKIGAKNIIFTGHRDDTEDIFRALDIFVLPSHIEPFGLVVLEAMACGVPVIATRSGGLQEIINEGNDGLLIPVNSPGAIAEKISYLLKNDTIAKKLSENARKTVEKRFSVIHYVKQIENLYNDYL